MTAPATKDIAIQRAEDFDLEWIWRDAGAPVDLTGMTASMVISRAFNSTPIIELTTGNGRITLGGSAGTITLHIDAADTSLLTFETALYNLYLVDGSTTIWLVKGGVTLNKGQYVEEVGSIAGSAIWGTSLELYRIRRTYRRR